MTINWTQHGTNDFLGQILARGEGITRTSTPSCKWGIIPKKALIRMGDLSACDTHRQAGAD
ncbi:MAG: hypothetical protein AYP45_15325 [Candidatus Brocadia carolinensis]|uniref:Uncharacterized protein n=1 Tax=Candidatus Brocadia carolinensis TaxID=1004156 RepID=A0A1V4AQG1_9BACT|nr:MAG: hypothetical protein AYP45_15325 [Candidatus Brocadia caroliniensis]